MYVRNLLIKDLRSFYSATLEFLAPGPIGRRSSHVRLPNVNIILGINGSGKSTVLDAIALALLSPLIASTGYRPYALIRRSSRGIVNRSLVEVETELNQLDLGSINYSTKEILEMRVAVERRGDVEFVVPSDESGSQVEQLFYDDSPAFFFVGYGAMRRVDADSSAESSSRRKLRHNRYERVASLFEDHYTLAPLSNWLPDWRKRSKRRFDEIVSLIAKLLPKSINFDGAQENGEFVFALNGTSVPFGALSDGYRAYLGWISDLLQHLCTAFPRQLPLNECEGVVMVDEIDLHIHPDWQRTIVPHIARTLPRLQFIFTTHSPIVVGTLERSNIWLIERRNGRPVIRRPSEEVFGLSADQILRSELFGLSSTRDASFKRRLDKIAVAAAKGDADAAIAFMRMAARGESAIIEPTDPDDRTPPPDWLKKIAARRS